MSETFLYIFSNLGLFLLKMLVQFGSFPLKNYPPLIGVQKNAVLFCKELFVYSDFSLYFRSRKHNIQ